MMPTLGANPGSSQGSHIVTVYNSRPPVALSFLTSSSSFEVKQGPQYDHIWSSLRLQLIQSFHFSNHHFCIEDVEENNKICDDHYLLELDTVQIVEEINCGPKLLDWATHDPGDPEMPYPPGVVDIIIMSRVPGEILGDIYQDLSDRQLRSIRTQLTHILE